MSPSTLPRARRLVLACCFWLLCLGGLPTPRPAHAASDVVYVDVGRAYLRTGPGVAWGQKNLVSEGARLEVLTRRGDWLEVRTSTGADGWILGRATTTAPPPEVALMELEQRFKLLEQTNTSLEERIRTLADARQDVELQASQRQAEISALNAQIEALQSRETFLWACLGVGVLLLGWGLGFVTGMSRRQLENRHQEDLAQASRPR